MPLPEGPHRHTSEMTRVRIHCEISIRMFAQGGPEKRTIIEVQPDAMIRQYFGPHRDLAEACPRKDDRDGEDDDKPKRSRMHNGVPERLGRWAVIVDQKHHLAVYSVIDSV